MREGHKKDIGTSSHLVWQTAKLHLQLSSLTSPVLSSLKQSFSFLWARHAFTKPNMEIFLQQGHLLLQLQLTAV